MFLLFCHSPSNPIDWQGSCCPAARCPTPWRIPCRPCKRISWGLILWPRRRLRRALMCWFVGLVEGFRVRWVHRVGTELAGGFLRRSCETSKLWRLKIRVSQRFLCNMTMNLRFSANAGQWQSICSNMWMGIIADGLNTTVGIRWWSLIGISGPLIRWWWIAGWRRWNDGFRDAWCWCIWCCWSCFASWSARLIELNNNWLN